MDGLGIERYIEVAGAEVLANIQKAARRIYGLRVLHVNSTFHGGGVAMMLNCLIPLMNDVGINADWNLLYGDPGLFPITKKIHNGVQGENVSLTPAEEERYLSVNETFARYSPIIHDVVVVHDPQPLPMIRYRQRENPWIWRCHIDFSTPNEQMLSMLKPIILRYDASVVSSENFQRPGLPLETRIIAPAIDPFSEINQGMSEEAIEGKLAEHKIPRDKPLIVQVSRFDKWKDPLGVLEVFKRLRKEIDCRLVMIGNMATDDPEGPQIFEDMLLKTQDIDDIHLITQTDPLLVNALQRTAAVVVQLSRKEGFGLTVSEALWKGTPVVATDVGGIPLQIRDGEMGFLVQPQDYDAAADRILKILRDPTLGAEFGGNGKEHVHANFLMPRLLLDWVELLSEMA
ncbi:MAG: glycosyltransferase [Candidatus Bipolaricaulota bacterium]|nr:glycosyltransferase [Candidatus Bipolaricaulota bacterium]